MKQFEPSSDFVSRVMKDVTVCEPGKERTYVRPDRLPASPLARYAMSAAGVLLGLYHLIRLYFSVLSPVICR